MSFEIKIIYGQISVFNSDLDSPYNDWSEKSQFQGFSWREGSVSFSVKDQDEPYSIFINEEFDTDIADTIIKVPFTSRGLCEIGSLLATKEIELTEGDYVLMFFKSEKENSIFFDFTESPGQISPKVIRGLDLPPNYEYFMSESPA